MKLLEIQDLTKNFGGLTAVNSLHMSIEAGQILGLIGPNGAGKSTVFNCVAGVYPPTSGKIAFKGKEITGQKPWDICRKRIARTFQLVKPFASKTVLYNIMVGTFSQTKSSREAEERALKVLETPSGSKEGRFGRKPHHRRPEASRAWPCPRYRAGAAAPG